jgi:pimeloyl-ACP methyl ester carboxylesterase
MLVRDIRMEPLQDQFQAVRLTTADGNVDCRYYRAQGATRACVWVPGDIGGWHSPARALYMRAISALLGDGMSSLQVLYRHPGDLWECARDVAGAIEFIQKEGVTAAALIGHSFGGAVVIQAAAQSDVVRTVVALSSQSYGAVAPASRLAPSCSILLVHGMEDEVLPPTCSRQIYQAARQPRRLVVVNGARHGLDEAADEITTIVLDWIRNALLPGTPSSNQ